MTNTVLNSSNIMNFSHVILMIWTDMTYLYEIQSNVPEGSDYVAFEIIDGHLFIVINLGSGSVRLQVVNNRSILSQLPSLWQIFFVVKNEMLPILKTALFPQIFYMFLDWWIFTHFSTTYLFNSTVEELFLSTLLSEKVFFNFCFIINAFCHNSK